MSIVLQRPARLAALSFPLVIAACNEAPKLPEANEAQAAIAAKICELSEWEWTSGINSFDGESAYPNHNGIAFSLDVTGLPEAQSQRTSERVAQLEACLAKELKKQGVGANIVGSTTQTARATDEIFHVPDH